MLERFPVYRQVEQPESESGHEFQEDMLFQEDMHDDEAQAEEDIIPLASLASLMKEGPTKHAPSQPEQEGHAMVNFRSSSNNAVTHTVGAPTAPEAGDPLEALKLRFYSITERK